MKNSSLYHFAQYYNSSIVLNFLLLKLIKQIKVLTHSFFISWQTVIKLMFFKFFRLPFNILYAQLRCPIIKCIVLTYCWNMLCTNGSGKIYCFNIFDFDVLALKSVYQLQLFLIVLLLLLFLLKLFKIVEIFVPHIHYLPLFYLFYIKCNIFKTIIHFGKRIRGIFFIIFYNFCCMLKYFLLSCQNIDMDFKNVKIFIFL